MRVEIALDSYDDLFSDFDIRNYRDRQFSVDFLDELKIRTRKGSSGHGLDIVLLLPQPERKAEFEALIAARLARFIAERRKRNQDKLKKAFIQSAIYIAIGIAIMLIANLFSGQVTRLVSDFMLIPSWFFIWNGLERFILHRQEFRAKLRYYGLLAKASFVFEALKRGLSPKLVGAVPAAEVGAGHAIAGGACKAGLAAQDLDGDDAATGLPNNSGVDGRPGDG
ncbi:MAG: hypothetical protein A2087_03140 [Spirochaetes bacterium GWD1_61_31]|nr:MAG: hypothetical protein A2Y37_12665 [Spirochaetes bacterium GWB1_60_80]OHD32939.1 MAG: hypothetical protein A2004_01040 [Spirochaetes bacterium GWC1_61_12]OHD38675.1 MAG: hypothetical protein A2087_03140 [Spirochaetes bacterium GWD1_61_31]OHD43216.1 MAG: hypothetical protein A2Y35_08290 [Spirochaetes bacterium GWE1_60_18]OHD58778.1 MAG: hypothetical protein A2Y32_01130 [Spirochaetes bacterium GWF1_60_12]